MRSAALETFGFEGAPVAPLYWKRTARHFRFSAAVETILLPYFSVLFGASASRRGAPPRVSRM